MNVAHRVLTALGAIEVRNVDTTVDPQTKEEFERLDYLSPTPITWEDYTLKYNEILHLFAIRQLRVERNIRLAKTDWIMTVDMAASLANKEEWIAYRQALRDLPANPPVFVWNGSNLNFSAMDMPVEPPILRVAPAPAPEPAPEA